MNLTHPSRNKNANKCSTPKGILSTHGNRTPLKRLARISLGVIAILSASACSVFGVESVDEAPYQVVSKDGKFEIREYERLVVVETQVDASYRAAGNQAFRKLFRYISGNNEANESIAMTAPVIADQSAASEGEKIEMTAPVFFDKGAESWRYQFVLPERYTMDSAPKPLDPDVALVLVPKQRVATLTYAGRGTAKRGAKNAEALSAWIDSNGLKANSGPRWAGYNAPWTLPPFRRNEVLINLGDL